jgi:3-oxoacyl-[acyl-carrier-protein] synthase III
MPVTRILGTGCCVPDRVVTNDDLAQLMDTSDEWIRQRTGIVERHWIRPGESGTGLSRVAAERALEMAGLNVADLDAIVYATSSPDHFVPGNGVFLQRALGADTIPAIDIRTQCSGFVYALSIADAYIRTGLFRTVLVVGTEVQSTGMDLSTRGRDTAVIFADGAGAVVAQAAEEAAGSAVLAWDLHGDGNYAEKLWVDAPGSIYHPRNQVAHLDNKAFLQMDGREVFRHATARMPESVRAVLDRAGLSPADITLLIPHQANLRISELVQRHLDLRDDQVYNNIDRFGNTTAATIPIALDECVRARRLKRGDLLVITAFGSGFLWGSAAIRW